METAGKAPHEFLTTAELADLLRTSPNAIHTARSRGEMPAVLGFRRGRRLLFRRSDIDGWVEAQINEAAQRVSETNGFHVGKQ